MNCIARVKELGLPKYSYVVVGSSVMVVLGLIEKDTDVDLTVTQDVFDKFRALGWKQEALKGEPVLK